MKIPPAFLIVVGLLCLATTAVAFPGGVTFYVATNGNDAWSGLLPKPNRSRTDGPLASLTGARDRIRAQRANIGNQSVQILVREGIYSLSAH